jgi:hypothetical protein
VRKIVIDLRQNGGGDFNVGRKYLVDEVARRPKLPPYVVTSARTFSAALKNAIDFDRSRTPRWSAKRSASARTATARMTS